MTIAFTTVDVFTSRPFGGNPLAVIPDATGLTGEQMQHIAREFNLSETTFVLPPQDPAHTARVRIFAPLAEVPFAGHPNIGTAFVLASRGHAHDRDVKDRIVFEEEAGLVEIDVFRNGDGSVASTRLSAPQALSIGDEIAVEIVAAACSLAPADFETARHRPCFASCGMPFVFAELKSRDALTAAVARTDVFLEHFPAARTSGIHLYVPTPGDEEEADFQSRMFGPLVGVPEDPATGSANVALIGLLASLDPNPDLSLVRTIGQGVDMGRPSVMHAEAEKISGNVEATRIGGQSVFMMEGSLAL